MDILMHIIALSLALFIGWKLGELIHISAGISRGQITCTEQCVPEEFQVDTIERHPDA